MLDSKKDAIYYHGGEGTLDTLAITSVAGGTTNGTVITVAEDPKFNFTFKYKLGTTATAVAYGDDLSAWTALTEGAEIAASTNTLIQVAEVTEDGIVVGLGQKTLVKKS